MTPLARLLMMALLMAALPAMAQQVPSAPALVKNAQEVPLVPLPKRFIPARSNYEPIPSLFYTESESAALEQAKKAFMNRFNGAQPEGDLLDQLQGITVQAQPQEIVETHYPQFYLETLMYRAPDNWSVSVKSTEGRSKFSPSQKETADGQIKILFVYPESVFLQWQPRNWAYVESHFRPQDDKLITLVPESRAVNIMLRVNQTFMAYDMSLKEGVMKPVPVPEAQMNMAPAQENANQLPAGDAGDTSDETAPPVARPNTPASKTILELYQDLESVNP